MMDSVNKRIVTALRPFGLDVAETLYEGDADEYFFYGVTLTRSVDHGDNDPLAYVAEVQVHYVCPLERSYSDTVRQVFRALKDAGFTGMRKIDRSDAAERIRHLVIECETEDEYMMED